MSKEGLKVTRRFVLIRGVVTVGGLAAACIAAQEGFTPVVKFMDTATPLATGAATDRPATRVATATGQATATVKAVETNTSVPTASLGAVEVLGAGGSTPLGIVDQASLQSITEKMGAGVTVYLEAGQPSGTIAQVGGGGYQGTISQVPKELMVNGVRYTLQLSSTPLRTPGISYLSTDGKNTPLILDNQWTGKDLNAAVEFVFFYQRADEPGVLAALALNNGEVVKGTINKVREVVIAPEATAVVTSNELVQNIDDFLNKKDVFTDAYLAKIGWTNATDSSTKKNYSCYINLTETNNNIRCLGDQTGPRLGFFEVVEWGGNTLNIKVAVIPLAIKTITDTNTGGQLDIIFAGTEIKGRRVVIPFFDGYYDKKKVLVRKNYAERVARIPVGNQMVTYLEARKLIEQTILQKNSMVVNIGAMVTPIGCPAGNNYCDLGGGNGSNANVEATKKLAELISRAEEGNNPHDIDAAVNLLNQMTNAALHFGDSVDARQLGLPGMSSEMIFANP